jgi:hypothetical protein
MLYYYAGLFIPRAREATAAKGLGNGYSFGNDFYQVWLASHECPRSGCDLYSPEMTREIQTGLYGRPLDPRLPSDFVDRRGFPYPAFTVLMFWPLAELPFTAVRILVLGLLSVVTVATVLLWLRALEWSVSPLWLVVTLLLTLCSYPVLEGLYAGQLGLVVGFLLSASILALQRGRWLFCGVLMGLTTIKPQVTLLVILYLLIWGSLDWRARARFYTGLLSTTFALVGASLAVWPRWIQSWIHTILAYRSYTTPVLVSEILGSRLGPGAKGLATSAVIVGLMIVAVLLAWRNRAAAADSPEFWFTLTILLSITVVALLPGQAVYDHVILLPGILLLARQWRSLRSNWVTTAATAIAAGVVLWPWFAALGLIIVRPLLTHEQFYSNVVLSLPLRTAAAFPFVVLGLLVLARRAPSASEFGKSSLAC